MNRSHFSCLLARDDFRLASGLLLGTCLLWGLARPPERRFDEFGLAKGTSGYRASFGDYPINTTDSREDIEMMLRGWAVRRSPPFALLLGNSQLHAINQRQRGHDKNAPELLFESRSTVGLEVLTINIPNASLSELFVLGAYVLIRETPQVVVVSACFDDTREEALRPSVREVLADSGAYEELRKVEAGERLTALIASPNQTAGAPPSLTKPDSAGLDGTVQQGVEDWLNRAVATVLPMWRERPTMRGRIELGLYRFRNYVLGISPQSKRRIIKPRYTQHMASLDALLQVCARRGIKCVVYIPPIRSDVAPPYVASEYDQFKKDVEAACLTRGGRFVNLESLVPAELWGKKESTARGDLELDFMHFQGPGHVLLADAIEEILKEAWPSERVSHNGLQ